MTAKRTDANQAEIVEGLRAMGATVQTLHEVGKGCPDILIGFRGHNYLIEIKVEGAGLNEREHRWHQQWRGQVTIARTLEQAVEIITRDE